MSPRERAPHRIEPDDGPEHGEVDLVRLPGEALVREAHELDEGTPDFDDYVRALTWAQHYARVNREVMLARALDALRSPALELPPFGMREKAVNCHHNYASRERHFGEDVWVTRKGAVHAGKGQLGLIPGSMGARSYIVRGLGSEASYQSSSHGAGRRMSRARARRELSTESLDEAMTGKVWNKDKAGALLDEHPASYKDIDQVMQNKRDLVEVVHSLRQIVNYKGT